MVPSCVYCPIPSTSSSRLWPPEMSRQRKGNSTRSGVAAGEAAEAAAVWAACPGPAAAASPGPDAAPAEPAAPAASAAGVSGAALLLPLAPACCCAACRASAAKRVAPRRATSACASMWCTGMSGSWWAAASWRALSTPTCRAVPAAVLAGGQPVASPSAGTPADLASRQGRRPCPALPCGQTHPQAQAEAWADGHRHCVQLVWGHTRGRQRCLYAAVDGRLVRLLRQLGHHAAPGGVDVGLRGQALAQHTPAGAHHRHARVIAAAFDAQHEAGGLARRRRRHPGGGGGSGGGAAASYAGRRPCAGSRGCQGTERPQHAWPHHHTQLHAAKRTTRPLCGAGGCVNCRYTNSSRRQGSNCIGTAPVV